MPMFPLGTVLFPFSPLPLRVFEPRYLTMVGRLLDEEDPRFGVVLIERGDETGGGDHRAPIGTLARLISVAAGADELHVVAVGTERIVVDRWLPDDPHPRAEIRALPPLVWHDALEPLRAEAEAVVRRVLARAAEPRWEADTPVSGDPLASAWQLASLAPVGEYDRYTLLRSSTTGGLLRQVIDLCLDAEALWD